MTIQHAELIKPCPFCGSPGRWFKTGRDVGIECGDTANCPGNAQTNTFEPEHKESALRTWNRREGIAAPKYPAVNAALSDDDIADLYFNRGCQLHTPGTEKQHKALIAFARAAIAKATGGAA